MEIGYSERLDAIAAYAKKCGKSPQNLSVDTTASAIIDGDEVYAGPIYLHFGRDSYGGTEVSVVWGSSRQKVNIPGLFQGFNPNWQDFEFDGDQLIISNDGDGGDYTIYIELP